ncbi:MAG TPA: N-acetylmuramoyl-L-alanine amidase, partial [Polyangiaceae bacterium]
LNALGKSPKHACDAGMRSALLEAELRREPGLAYRKLHGLKLEHDDARCLGRIERALRGLAAYRPLPSVLSEVEREIRGRVTEVATTGTESSTNAVVSPTLVPEGLATISRIERYGADDAARIVVFVTRPARFEVGRLTGDDGTSRLFVDIPGATSSIQRSYDVGGLVQRVRLGNDDRGARVVLDLRAPAESRIFYLPEPFRLVIDVSAPGVAPRIAGTKRVVRRVVLDPGHGGHDPGATGRTGLREKDVALDIAHRAAPVIARELGITTLLTRDGDYYVPLDERTARANAFFADLFISIHCNASQDGGAQGVMTFVLDRSREAIADRFAARENAASAEAGAELANALARVADPVHTGASLRFAELLQRAATASLAKSYPDIPDGGVKRAGFYVLAGARMPAVLFETSFISSSSGESRLNTADFRQKMADAIVNAVRAYRDGH